MIILGLDPGLGTTGWGVIAAEGNRLRHLANGQIRTDPSMPLPRRLANLYNALIDVIRAEEGSRISVCADDTCRSLALDLSRNRSKRYCSTACANRNAVAAYRARRAEA